MTIKKILVPLLGLSMDETVLALAMSIAGKFAAQVEGLFVRPDLSEALPYMGEGIAGPVIEDIINLANQASDQAAAAARNSFERASQAAGERPVGL